MHHHNVDTVARYVNHSLIAQWDDRNRLVLRIVQKSGGVLQWAELVVGILNAAIQEGATQRLIDLTVLEMPGDLDGLYEWLLSTLTAEEKAETLALFQWVILASEPPRLNDLKTAVRITPPWAISEMRPENALVVDDRSTLGNLGRSVYDPEAFDNPQNFHRWLRTASVGLLEVRPWTGIDKGRPSNVPLGLRRVHVIHESVRTFFLSGRGFAALDKNNVATLYSHSWSEDDLADLSHYVLLNTCIAYLSMADFDHVGSHGQQLAMAPMPTEEVKFWRAKQYSERRIIISSYPFLKYAVNNLLYHMLSPRAFRYHMPQKEILKLFAANNCRLWRLWTALLGVKPSDPDAALAVCARGPAGPLLDPVYGACYRLERVFRRVSKLAEKIGVQAPYGRGTNFESASVRTSCIIAKTQGSVVEQGIGSRKGHSTPEPPRHPGSNLRVETGQQRPPRQKEKPPVSMGVSPTFPASSSSRSQSRGQEQGHREQRVDSYTSSSDVPSIFSPVDCGPGSPMSAQTLLSPLSALEAGFEGASKGYGQQRGWS